MIQKLREAVCFAIVLLSINAYAEHTLVADAHTLPVYEITDKKVASVLDSLALISEKSATPIIGDIFISIGRVSMISIQTLLDNVRNYPTDFDSPHLCGILHYRGIMWYIYQPLQVLNIFQETGDSIAAFFCAEEVTDYHGTKSKTPCSYKVMDDMYGGVELLFDAEPSGSNDSIFQATNIREISLMEVKKLSTNPQK